MNVSTDIGTVIFICFLLFVVTCFIAIIVISDRSRLKKQKEANDKVDDFFDEKPDS